MDADTGLYYYRARWYDPQVGRFISEDPIGFRGGDINLYGYVWQNPLSYRDPFGLDGWGNDLADWGDRKINALRRRLEPDPDAVYFNTAVNYATNTYHGFANMFRVGSGIGHIVYGPPDNGYGIAADILQDVSRAAGIFVTLGGPAAGIAGNVTEAPAGEMVPETCECPSYLGQESGPAIPVPEGANGPTPTRGPGFQYTDGSGGNGLDPRVSNVRIMDPTPRYPNGYVNYSNGAVPRPQSVNPYTGQTVGKSCPWWHIPRGR